MFGYANIHRIIIIELFIGEIPSKIRIIAVANWNFVLEGDKRIF